jgi:chromate transporter
MERWLPRVFCKGTFDEQTRECRIEDEADHLHKSAAPSVSHVLRVLLVCLVLWGVVVGGVWAWRGMDDVLGQIALFFTKAAFVTFGGAYAVLAYITDFAVGNGWLGTEQMMIGLGLAESTPGPLIMVTQYVGF